MRKFSAGEFDERGLSMEEFDKGRGVVGEWVALGEFEVGEFSGHRFLFTKACFFAHLCLKLVYWK